MADEYYIVEPFIGSKSSHSKLERYWNSFEGNYGLRTMRITQFDPYASMSRSPVKYILQHFDVTDTLPDERWIENALNSFVRDEVTHMGDDVPKNFGPVVQSEIFMSDDFISDFMRRSEWENLLRIELPKDNTVYEMANSIYNLLCNQQIGSSKNRINNDKEAFINHITPLLEDQKRLLFVLPGFPFKDQNRFRVPYGTESVDFGEVSFLIRLHNLIQTLYQVHPYGADAVILSDGRLYKDIFYVDDKDVEEYQWRLIYYRNKLNIQGAVSIIDLKELIERADSKHEISAIIDHIESIISSKHSGTRSFATLIQAMKWNMNSKKLLGDLCDADAWNIIKESNMDVRVNLKSRWEKYHELAKKSAIRYAAVNLMLRWTDLLRKFFPEAIRCTVHPKKDQFALCLNYAWNGVGWSEKWPHSIEDISTVSFYQLEEYKTVHLVRIHSTGYPCFYTTERYNKIFDCAKRVLKSDGWNVDNIFGREFTIYDCDDFVALGKNDENFAWERRVMSEEYYSTLLQFRIKHYKKYEFGVHAIFMDGKLIGQMGLQVLSEQQNQLEYVIFLGKQYTQRGIGKKLLKYLFSRCKEEGINTVFGVIRSDNEAGKKLVEGFNAQIIKTMAHYHQTGILYRIDL